jgi:hypothetical protein
MTKKEKREIRVEYFKIEGFPYSITFTPQEDKIHYQILNEQTTRIITKGEV